MAENKQGFAYRSTGKIAKLKSKFPVGIFSCTVGWDCHLYDCLHFMQCFVAVTMVPKLFIVTDGLASLHLNQNMVNRPTSCQ